MGLKRGLSLFIPVGENTDETLRIRLQISVSSVFSIASPIHSRKVLVCVIEGWLKDGIFNILRHVFLLFPAESLHLLRVSQIQKQFLNRSLRYMPKSLSASPSAYVFSS